MNSPTYLENYVKHCESKFFSTMTLCLEENADLFEVWYFGDLFFIEETKEKLIVDTEQAPMLIVAKAPEREEEILLFDGAKHGYDSMFCDKYDEEVLQNRPLKKFDIPASKLLIEVGYSIDYESEKEEYEVDEQGLVELIDGRKISWNQVKRDGFDALMISAVDTAGRKTELVNEELA